MKTHTDINKNGVFAVKDARGTVLFDTFADTPYSARAAFKRIYNRHWRVAQEQGYTMAEFAQVAQVHLKPRLDALPIPKTAEAWSLPSEYETVAQALGALLEKLLVIAHSEGRCTPKEAVHIRDVLFQEMANHSVLGSIDAEPEGILVTTIETSFGLPSNSLWH